MLSCGPNGRVSSADSAKWPQVFHSLHCTVSMILHSLYHCSSPLHHVLRACPLATADSEGPVPSTSPPIWQQSLWQDVSPPLTSSSSSTRRLPSCCSLSLSLSTEETKASLLMVHLVTTFPQRLLPKLKNTCCSWGYYSFSLSAHNVHIFPSTISIISMPTYHLHWRTSTKATEAKMFAFRELVLTMKRAIHLCNLQ